uniref:Uncharacterized protein n=1 Tax=Musa acuminata subsp. malaccensis TaxID=214687 RepID=A0A804JGI1_MUSAM
MPVPKDLSKKGNLRVKFNIKIPTRFDFRVQKGVDSVMSACLQPEVSMRW